MVIHFITSSKTLTLTPTSKEQPLIDLLKSKGIPYSSVTIYSKVSGKLNLCLGLYKSIQELANEAELLLIIANRNINYDLIINEPISIEETIGATSEYSFNDLDQLNTLNHFELSAEDCKLFVEKRINTFFDNDISYANDSKIVVGISGGGDSNALLHGLISGERVSKENIVPVMIMGIPDWDKGVNRAIDLCHSYGLSLNVIEKNEVNSVLRKNSNSFEWAKDFEKVYPDTDLEVIGTLAIRLVLSKIAKDNNAQAIVTGINMEDILGECFFFVLRGELPLPFPERKVDGTKIWYPLYRCPKKIIDGCFPKLSLENYQDRYPSKLIWRAIAYYFSQSIHPTLPGIENVFLDGFKEIARTTDRQLVLDERLGFSTLEEISNISIEKWYNYLNFEKK